MSAQRLMATFRPQKWRGDYAEDLDGEEVEFDATEQFLSLPLDRIRSFREHNYDSDNLAADLEAWQDHGGPFEVDADIDEWLESLGYPPRAELTEEQLLALREMFDVRPARTARSHGSSAMKFTVLLEKEDDGWSAQCRDLPCGIMSSPSRDEALASIREEIAKMAALRIEYGLPPTYEEAGADFELVELELDVDQALKIRRRRAPRTIGVSMTIYEVRKRLAAIRELASGPQRDPESAHTMIDNLYVDVLRVVSGGAENSRQLAKAALKAEEIDCPRW